MRASSQALPSHFFWIVAAAVLACELLAFCLLCVHQMQRAELRKQLLQVQARAFSDCLAYVSGSTIASCNRLLRVRR
ncbi:MAG: hypothetical protein RIS88_1528 [Pseudomonadota bacterium]|jgi:hypothetical protein